MRFIRTVWKLLVGVKDALVLIFMLLFFGLLYAGLSANPTLGSGDRGALLLDLSSPIVEQPNEPDATALFAGGTIAQEYRLRDLVHAIRAAASDERIEVVALDLDIFAGGGQAALANVGEALDEVRRSGKPVIAYATAYTDDTYQLAAHATEIWVNPMGGVLIAGPGGANLYFRGLLDRLGVTANVYRAGTFKSAVEPFTRNDMSPESRQAAQALAGSMWETWQDEVRRARPKAQVAAYVAAPADRIAAAGGDMARAALAARLVDHVGDRAAFARRIARITGEDADGTPGSFRHVDLKTWSEANLAGETGGEIGVITVAGTISDGDAPLGSAGAETIVDALEKGRRERNLKALVVRIDSPGGSALASERIRRAVMDAKASGLPVVVSMGSVAASGGYWIATAGDAIFAEPSTITGSIGVFGILPSFQGAMQNLGIGADGVRTTPLSGEPDLFRGPSPEAGRLLQMGVDNTYRQFLALVSRSRNLPVERVNEIAQGRVWDGGTARQLRLVDRFGSLEDAIAEAARRAEVDPETARPVFLEKELSFSEEMLRAFAGSESEQIAADPFSRLAARPQEMLMRALADAEQLLSGAAIQARCLECPAGPPPRSLPVRSTGAAWLWELLTG